MSKTYIFLFQKEEAIMCMINDFITFFSNGVKTFRDAATGNYMSESDAVRKIREDIMNDNSSDSDNLRHDWKMVGRDVRVSYDKMIVEHV